MPLLLVGTGALEGPARVEGISMSAHKVYHVTHPVSFAVGDARIVGCRPFKKQAPVVSLLRMGRHPATPIVEGLQPGILLLTRRRDDLGERRWVHQREPPNDRRPR